MLGIAIVLLVIAFFVFVMPSLLLRIVVPTNVVHIVQHRRATVSYGRGQTAGNTYYRWPSWVPMIGVRVTILPVSIFDRKLIDYAAYDIDRVPFVIDVVGFFRIHDTNAASERVKDFADLEDQLEPVLQGAARTILATSTIDEILGSRAVFAEKFTLEVTKDLLSWGVEPVKSIELMDIRDANGSQVIANIMAKKKSFIEMESRTAVANNGKLARTAEIEAVQAVQVRQQEADELVGQRTAMRDQNVGVSQQKAAQAIQDEAAITETKKMAVVQVQIVRQAEIQRDAQVVAASQTKQVAILTAEGSKQQMILNAEASLATAQLGAQGIKAQGEAKANAETLILLAPVTAQTTLAKEIGSNEGYQKYLVDIRQVEARQAVGIAQASALEKADVKVIATAADASAGIDLVSLGTRLGAAFKAVTQSEAA